MSAVRFERRGAAAVTVPAPPGARLLDLAQAAGMPLEGTCGGDMACATCHVVVDPAGFAALPPASAEEEDLLDMLPAAVRTSRLACQLFATPEWDTLRIVVPE